MLLNTNTTLWPPKPNESFRAAISPAGNSLGVLRTTSIVTAGSKSSMLIVGGAKRSWRVFTIKTDSIAPAPPSKWPVIDLVAETAT